MEPIPALEPIPAVEPVPAVEPIPVVDPDPAWNGIGIKYARNAQNPNPAMEL